MLTRLPNFIIIGAAKAATTTLTGYLRRHPDIFMASPKEPEFFARDEYYIQGINEYSTLFSASLSDQVCGEASTIYSRAPIYPNVPERMARIIKKVKLIYIMREPISRTYSDYAMVLRYWINTKQINAIHLSFEQALEASEGLMGSLKVTSDYLFQIEQYLRFFRRDQMFFLLMEDIINFPRETCKKIFSFLDIDNDFDVLSDHAFFSNTRRSFEIQVRRNEAAKRLSKLPLAHGLKRIIPRLLRERIYDLYRYSPFGSRLAEHLIAPPMTEQTRIELGKEFDPKVAMLSKFLKRDLSHWRALYQTHAT